MSSTGNTNPGNFANRPREEVQEIEVKGVNLVALETLVAPVTPPKRLHPLATRIPGILPTDRRRKSRRLQAKAGKPQAAPLSLAVRRRVRLEAGWISVLICLIKVFFRAGTLSCQLSPQINSQVTDLIPLWRRVESHKTVLCTSLDELSIRIIEGMCSLSLMQHWSLASWRHNRSQFNHKSTGPLTDRQ
jgi:hypothetical protein